MDELVKLVSEKTGLNPEMSKMAVVTVIGFLKDKLPAPIAQQLDLILQGQDAGGVTDIVKGLGGMFGGK